MNELCIWTVYENPLDYPGEFVARMHVIERGGSRPTDRVVRAKSLEGIRYGMRIMGLHCLGREPGDEPQIVESWI